MKILKKIKNVNNVKNKEIKKLINSKIEYNIEFLKSKKKANDRRKIGIFKDNKMIVSGDYNFYGIFQPSTNIWIWASSIPGIDIRMIKNIQKLRSFSHLFDSDSDPIITFYYQLLTQDMMYITDMKMLNYINELILYLTDDMYYFNPTNSESFIQFITLVNIKEKYI